MSKSLAKSPRAEQWAGRIRTQIGKSVESIIEVGHLLLKAKADLAHGEWGRLFEDELLPFSIDTAQQLMKVAAHPQLSKTEHARFLPPSWTTLYQLTKVEPKRLTAAFKDGVITPDMPRKSVNALLPPKPKREVSRAQSKRESVEAQVVAVEEDDRFDSGAVVLGVVNVIREAAAQWPREVSLDPLIVRLRSEADRLADRQSRLAS